jgi:hypothetical protein
VTQEPSKRKKRAPGDEGALYTQRIADAVAGRRNELGWSAERLAEEMAAVAVPWTRDVVVNLENGRRKSIAVHELLTLAWVLDIPNPVDLLVPHGHGLEAVAFPVTPGILVNPELVRAWFAGETGPLRPLIVGQESELLADVKKMLGEHGLSGPEGEELAQHLAGLIARPSRMTASRHHPSAIEGADDEEGNADGGL